MHVCAGQLRGVNGAKRKEGKTVKTGMGEELTGVGSQEEEEEEEE